MGLPKYKNEPDVLDYHLSVKELKIRSIEEGLLKIGIDPYHVRKIAHIILYYKTIKRHLGKMI